MIKPLSEKDMIELETLINKIVFEEEIPARSDAKLFSPTDLILNPSQVLFKIKKIIKEIRIAKKNPGVS